MDKWSRSVQFLPSHKHVAVDNCLKMLINYIPVLLLFMAWMKAPHLLSSHRFTLIFPSMFMFAVTLPYFFYNLWFATVVDQYVLTALGICSLAEGLAVAAVHSGYGAITATAIARYLEFCNGINLQNWQVFVLSALFGSEQYIILTYTMGWGTSVYGPACTGQLEVPSFSSVVILYHYTLIIIVIGVLFNIRTIAYCWPSKLKSRTHRKESMEDLMTSIAMLLRSIIPLISILIKSTEDGIWTPHDFFPPSVANVLAFLDSFILLVAVALPLPFIRSFRRALWLFLTCRSARIEPQIAGHRELC